MANKAQKKKTPAKSPAKRNAKKVSAKKRLVNKVAAAGKKVTQKKATIRKPAPKSAKKSSARNSGATQNTETMETIMTQGKSQFDKFSQETANGGKDQMDAFMQSGTLLMKGFEGMLKTYMGMAQKSTEQNTQAFKSLMGCKTLHEFTEAQNQVTQKNMDDMMSCAAELSELGIKITTEAMEPVNGQLGKSIKNATKSMAA